VNNSCTIDNKDNESSNSNNTHSKKLVKKEVSFVLLEEGKKRINNNNNNNHKVRNTTNASTVLESSKSLFYKEAAIGIGTDKGTGAYAGRATETYDEIANENIQNKNITNLQNKVKAINITLFNKKLSKYNKDLNSNNKVTKNKKSKVKNKVKTLILKFNDDTKEKQQKLRQAIQGRYIANPSINTNNTNNHDNPFEVMKEEHLQNSLTENSFRLARSKYNRSRYRSNTIYISNKSSLSNTNITQYLSSCSKSIDHIDKNSIIKVVPSHEEKYVEIIKNREIEEIKLKYTKLSKKYVRDIDDQYNIKVNEHKKNSNEKEVNNRKSIKNTQSYAKRSITKKKKDINEKLNALKNMRLKLSEFDKNDDKDIKNTTSKKEIKEFSLNNLKADEENLKLFVNQDKLLHDFDLIPSFNTKNGVNNHNIDINDINELKTNNEYEQSEQSEKYMNQTKNLTKEIEKQQTPKFNRVIDRKTTGNCSISFIIFII